LQNTLFYFAKHLVLLHQLYALDASNGAAGFISWWVFRKGTMILLFYSGSFRGGLKTLSLIMAVSKMKKKFGWLAFFHYFCMLESVTYHV